MLRAATRGPYSVAPLDDSWCWLLQSLHSLSRMFGCGAALKGCATRTGSPALALDRNTAAKPSAMILF